ncbi:MAG: single-stranded DNA-binding protein [Spirochaetes bacterium]|nr:single-stranded DNA-binding protein [Spirochaetota bacterium]
MSDLNTVALVGRLTRDAEEKVNGKGSSWLLLYLANNYFYYHNSEKKEEANFFRVKVWGKMAESLKVYLVKGIQVGIQGRLSQYNFKGTDDKMFNIVEIVADRIQLISPRKKALIEQKTGDTVQEDVPF